MSDPMSLFQQSQTKEDNSQEQKEPSSSSRALDEESSTRAWPTPLSDEPMREEDGLPEDWKERLNLMKDQMAKMRDEASVLPSKYNMTKDQFDAFMHDRKNFSKEEWELICQAREQTDDFVQQLKEITGKYSSLKKTKAAKKKRVGTQRGWISVN